jgi:acylphosphatase
MNATAKQIIFVGRVQGVGFRFTAYNVAKRYSLTGYVRNLLDGTVEMVAQGPSDDIDNCISDINQAFGGYVRETKIEQIPPNPQCNDFKITF